MGVDCTLLVLAQYGPYVAHTFSLNRDCQLWEILEGIVGTHSDRELPDIQIALGAWSNYGGEIPDGYEDREPGHIQNDIYGNSLRSFKGRHLAGVESGYGLNTAILKMVADHFGDHDVVLFWS